MDEGNSPRQLEIAREVPIHKGGDRVTVSNCRPISLLKSFSKIYAKIMHNRILNFLPANSSLHEAQYVFRPGRSCEHALFNAQSVLLNSIISNQISLLLLIDFSKAFDMVDHEILAKKTAASWNRRQSIRLDEIIPSGLKPVCYYRWNRL